MPTIDLWPDFKIETKPRGIRQMLEEAGSALKEKTNGLVEFRVFTDETWSGASLRLRCDLYVGKLNYAYHLLEVLPSPKGFPAELQTGQNSNRVESEEQLMSVLATVFRSEETKAVIENLISMATE